MPVSVEAAFFLWQSIAGPCNHVGSVKTRRMLSAWCIFLLRNEQQYRKIKENYIIHVLSIHVTIEQLYRTPVFAMFSVHSVGLDWAYIFRFANDRYANLSILFAPVSFFLSTSNLRQDSP